MTLRFLLYLTLTIVPALLSPANGLASTLESLVMPGKVIEGHAEYEDDCEQCHQSFAKLSQASLCMDCHEEVAADVQQGTGFHGRIPEAKETECKRCHSDHLGRDADVVQLDQETFNHRATDFELKGGHVGLGCSRCHKADQTYREAPGKCFTCPEDADVHDGNLGEDCNDCHRERGWKETGFDHNDTDFPLEGAHEEVSCNACHPNERYKNTPSVCVDCHRLNDYHGGRYGGKCNDCHGSKAWDEPTFDHDTDTDYKLEGKHDQVLCDTCHTGDDIYKDELKTDCFSCHKDADDHKGRYGEKCEDCHAPKGWSKTAFDHDKETDFALKDSHADLACGACHKGTVEKEERDANCYSCHRKDDIHKGQEGEQCDRCHNERGWGADVFFDHDLTRFPLIGLHATAPCQECHLGGAYRDTALDCLTCHKGDDDHKGRQGPACETCHNPNSWALWQFDHNKQTDFELDGSHEGLACDACHRKRVKKEISLSSACGSCHQEDDIHDGGFGKQCDRCHNTEAFDEIEIEY